MKVHVDTDIGGDIDDLCALALLLASEAVELVGVTTAAEDRGRRAGYIRHVLHLTGRTDMPVAAGIDVASGEFQFAPSYPSDLEFWGQTIPPEPGDASAALDLLEANIGDGALVLAIGPYTNLAALERRRPGILARTPVVLMGTHVVPSRAGYPTLEPRNDYNVQLDSSAAELVLQRADPLLVPLGPCLETVVCRSDIPALQNGGPVARLLAQQVAAFDRLWGTAARWGSAYPRLPPDTVNFLYDPLACAAALEWPGIAVDTLRLNWIRGEHDVLYGEESRAGKSYRVVTRVDGEGFRGAWLDAVCRV
jgi:purine nucleosidase